MKTLPFRTRIALDTKARTTVVTGLNERLAEATDLQLQAKHAHWNVRSPSFTTLHALFDAVHTVAETAADTMAERIAQLGGFAQGTLAEVAKASELPAMPPEETDATAYLEQLATALALFANNVRTGIDEALEVNDQVTANLLADLGMTLDKHLWMVDAHLQGGK